MAGDGAIVSRINEGGSADGKLVAGDRIVAINGHEYAEYSDVS